MGANPQNDNNASKEISALRADIAAMRSDLARIEKATLSPLKRTWSASLMGEKGFHVTVAHWWQKLRAKYGDTDLVLGGTVSVHTVVYWGFGLTMMALDPFLQKWKLQAGKTVTRKQYIKLFKRVLFNQGLGVLMFAVIRKVKAVQSHCKMLCEVPIPSPRRMVLETAFHFVVNDVVFYFLHGLLHTPMFYRRIHKIHHEFKAPVALASEYSHPLEYFLSNIIPGAIGPHLLGSHPITTWLWLLIGICMTSFHHSGFVIPFYPFNEWALLHDFHHFSFFSNLGVTGLLDKTLGTDGGADYTLWRKEIIKRVKIANSFLFWKHPISEKLQVW